MSKFESLSQRVNFISFETAILPYAKKASLNMKNDKKPCAFFQSKHPSDQEISI